MCVHVFHKCCSNIRKYMTLIHINWKDKENTHTIVAIGEKKYLIKFHTHLWLKTLQIWNGRKVFIIWWSFLLKKEKKRKPMRNTRLNGEILNETWDLETKMLLISPILCLSTFYLFSQVLLRNHPALCKNRFHFPPMYFLSSMLALISLCY